MVLSGALGVDGGGRGRTPEIDHAVYDGLAGGHVDDLEVDDHLDALLIFDQVAADVLPAGVVWALGHLGAEDAGVDAGEEGGLRGEGGVVDAGKMGCVQDGSGVSCAEVRGACTIVSEVKGKGTLYSLVERPLFSRVLFAMAARLWTARASMPRAFILAAQWLRSRLLFFMNAARSSISWRVSWPGWARTPLATKADATTRVLKKCMVESESL